MAERNGNISRIAEQNYFEKIQLTQQSNSYFRMGEMGYRIFPPTYSSKALVNFPVRFLLRAAHTQPDRISIIRYIFSQIPVSSQPANQSQLIESLRQQVRP